MLQIGHQVLGLLDDLLEGVAPRDDELRGNLLDELNQAVLHGRWTDARRVAELYIDRLQSMDLRARSAD